MSRSPRRVRSVRHRTIGSGTRLADEIQVPAGLYYGGRGVAWAARHWRVTGPIAFFLVLWSGVGLVAAVLLFGVLTAGCLTAWLVWRRSAAEGGRGGAGISAQDLRLRATLRKQWPLACRTAKLLGPETGEAPKLAKLTSNGHGTFTATVESGKIGVPVSDIGKQASRLADVLGCREVVVSQTGPGVARLYLHTRDSIGRPLPLAEMPIAPDDHLAYGRRQDGTVATIRATQSVLIGGLTRHGKALALDTPVPTPSGWTTMGELSEGDVIYSETGAPCTVTNAWEVRYDRPCYRVTFSDGSTIVADAEHQWAVETAASRQSAAMSTRRDYRGGPYSHDQSHLRARPQVLTTEQMAATQRTVNTNHRANYSIPLAGVLQAPTADLPVPPYTLGAWLGDGTSAASTFTTADPETLLVMASEGVEARKMDCGGPYLYSLRFADAQAPRETCAKCEYGAIPGQIVCGAHLPSKIPCTRCALPCRAILCAACRVEHGPSLTAALRRAGVLGNKHIPTRYLRASEAQRRALLAGLLDTDGYCDPAGRVLFYNTNERLARDFFHLVASLGYKPTIRSKTARLNGKDCGLVWIVGFTPTDKVFRLQRKLERQVASTRSNTGRRYIVSIESVEPVPVRCIAVDSPSHLFLVGEACIATHNSNFVWALLADAIRQGMYVDLYVSDPKGGVELDQLEAQLNVSERRLLRVRQYAKSPAETVKMVEAAEKAMHARQHWMKQNGARKIIPDATNPLVVVILDETLPLTDLLKKGTDSALGRIAYTGSAAAYVVWANTQVAQIDALGRFRDLIPQRVCFATSSPQVTDAVLGVGAEGQGARCSDINEPGVGYSYAEGDKGYRKFRAALVTDAETRGIAQGRLPAKVASAAMDAYFLRDEETMAGRPRGDRPTGLYRHFYVNHREYMDSLGYVGVGYNTLVREAQHAADLREFMDGERRVTVEWYPTRAEALAAEKVAIETEKPIHNKQHNMDNPNRKSDRPRLRRRDKVA